MAQFYAPDQVIDQITTLTADRLSHFEQLRIISPVQTPKGPRYYTVDVRRLTLLCELTDDFEVNEDALVIIMSLLDQLHGTQSKLEQILKAIAQEPTETKLRLSKRLNDIGSSG